MREEAKQRMLKLASVFHHLPSVGPKQLCALAYLGYTRELDASKFTKLSLFEIQYLHSDI